MNLEELKAKAQEFLQMAGCYVGDNIVIGEGDLDDLIDLTHQATIEECVRIIESKLEEYAALEHERWSKWQRYMHGKLDFNGTDYVLKNELFERWNRQIHTPYCNLSEEEKESDRDQVRPYLNDMVTTITRNSK